MTDRDTIPTVGEPGLPPEHYRGAGMQPFDVIDAFSLDFYEGNAVKYLLRWRRKGGVDDLRKARHYIDELITRAAVGEGGATQNGRRPRPPRPDSRCATSSTADPRT